jgi:hypothetical protein
MLWIPLPTIFQIGTWRTFFQQVAKLIGLLIQARATCPKTTTIKTPTILTILLTTTKTIHTNTTTPTVMTRGRPANITFAHNDSRQHFDPINVSTIIGYWKSSIPGHFTYAKNSFFAHYAFCHALNKFIQMTAYEEYYTLV